MSLPPRARYPFATALVAAAALLTGVSQVLAQAPTRLTSYDDGTVTDVYVGACDTGVPGTEGLVTFCDAADNLHVVRESRGLSGRAVEEIIPNYFDDDLILVTREGLSTRRADGSWDNLPTVAFRRSVGQRTANDLDIRAGVVAGDGRAILTAGNSGGYLTYDARARDLDIVDIPNGGTAFAAAYDPDRETTWVLVIRGQSGVDLLSLSDGADADAFYGEIGVTWTAGFDAGRPRVAYADGRLFVGSSNGGLFVLSDLDAAATTGVTVTQYDAQTTGRLPEGFNQVTDVAAAPDAALVYFAANDRNRHLLFRLDPDAGTLDTLTTTLPDDPTRRLRWDEIAVGPGGRLTASAANLTGIVDVAGADGDAPVYSFVTGDTLRALGVPTTYRPSAVAYEGGRFVYGTVDGSSGINDNFEVLLRDIGTGAFAGLSDNAPGNLSAVITRRYDDVFPDGDGGLWWLNSLDELVTYVSPAGQTALLPERNLNADAAVDGAGLLVYTTTESMRRTTRPRPTPVPGATRSTRAMTAFGDEVWATTRIGDTVEVIVDGRVARRSPLDAALSPSRYFDAAADAAGRLWLFRTDGDTARLLRHDLGTDETVAFALPARLGQARTLEAAPDGGVWAVGRSGALHFDGQTATVLDGDTDAAIPGIEDAVVDTNGVLYLQTLRTSRITRVTGVPGAEPLVEAFDLDRDFLPTADLFGASTLTLDADGHLWVGGGNGTGFVEVRGLGTAPAYRPGAPRPRLTGRVYADADGDGAYDAGEGVPNLAVAIRDADGVTTTVTTDSTGRYRFLLLGGEGARLTVSLPRLPRLTRAPVRQAEVTLPTAATADVPGPDFVLEDYDYASLLLQSANRSGAWGFDRAGFRNAYTVGVTNLSAGSRTFEDVEVELAYVNADADAPPLPAVEVVRLIEIRPAGGGLVFDRLAIDPQTHAWRLRGLREGVEYTLDTLEVTPVITDTDDTVRARVTIPVIAPQRTFVIEVETENFAAEGAGVTIVHGTTGVAYDGEDGGRVSLGGGPFLLPPDDDDSGYEPDDRLGELDLDPNSPYFSPDDIYEEPPFTEPSEVYAEPPYESPLFSSYDPNDKLVDHGLALCPDAEPVTGDASCANVTALDTEELAYTIRFENTGNFSAKDVFVLDTLDPQFEVASLRILESSHEVALDVLAQAGRARGTGAVDSSVVRFRFDDIYLPFQDSINDGWVRFAVRLSAKPVAGDVVRNNAAIYFDQNPPIYTNTVRNRYEAIVNVNEAVQREVGLRAYPNPTRGTVTLVSEGAILSAEVTDVRGGMVLRQGADSDVELGGLAAGMYVVRARTAAGVGVVRVVVD